MKRIALIFALIILLSLPVFAQAQYNFLGLGIIGLSNLNLNELAGNEAKFFDEAIWGINGKLKLTKFFGVAFDVFYVGSQYYYGIWNPYTYHTDWYGPTTWNMMITDLSNHNIPTTGLSKDSWEYYHDEFYINIDIGFYLPLAFLQLYFEFGPSFFSVKVNEDVEYDSNFMQYYYSIYGNDNDSFTLGLNFKIGLDIFLGRSISLGAFLYFIEPSISNFISNMRANPQQYIMENGYIGLEIMLWL